MVKELPIHNKHVRRLWRPLGTEAHEEMAFSCVMDGVLYSTFNIPLWYDNVKVSHIFTE